jgi:histidine triad (HIT) family protein
VSDCIFCKIISGDLPCEKVYEDQFVLGFKDLNPLAKIHNLFIHKEHSKNVNEMSSDQISTVYSAIKKFTEDEGLDESGFRVVTNIGKDGGQTVFHTHFHVLAGERLGGFGS